MKVGRGKRVEGKLKFRECEIGYGNGTVSLTELPNVTRGNIWVIDESE